MQTMLGVLVIVGTLLQIQVRYVCGSFNGYTSQVSPAGFWNILTNLDSNNNPANGYIRDHRSAHFYNGYDDVPNFHPAFYQIPQIYDNGYVQVPHLSVRRSVPKLPKQLILKLKPTTEATPTSATEGNIDTQFLDNYSLDLDKVAYNSAKYIQLSIYIVLEHVKCTFGLMKLIVSHIGRKAIIILKNPLQLVLLPFTMPVDFFKFSVETLKFGVTFLKHLFSRT